MEGEQNCAHVGVYGHVFQRSGGAPVPYVTIQIKGDEDQFKGPYIGKTNENGDYTILIAELNGDLNGVEFEAEVIGGAGVESLDTPDWEVSDDCKKDGAIQVMRIDWKRKDS